MNTLSKKPSNSFLDGVNPKVILSFLLIIIAGVLYYSFPPDPTEPTHLVWETQIGQLGVGSPRLADVNKDGVLDIFIGSGFEWSEDGDSAMQLIDGATGQSIWRVETPKSAYGTPVLIDINNDGVVDVTASGRFSDFYMMDGRTGKILWKVSEVNPNVALLPCNFNSPVFIRDQDGDGLDDLMVIQSGLADDSVHLRLYDEKTGQVLVDRYSRQSIEKSIADFLKTTTDQTLILRICQGEVCEVKSVDRSIFERYTFDVFMSKIFFNQEGPGGQVYVISSKSGQILRQFPVPFGRESWSVPIYFIHQGIETIIYGTGGERKDGHLVAQNAQTGALLWQIPSKSKGIISSPILYMENNQPFVVSNSMGGEVWKVNALSGELAWHKVIGAEYETYSSPAVIQRDDRIDIVSVFAYGVWPKYSSASLFILDGHTGQVNFRKPLGRCNSASSPLIADMDNDNREDILVITCVDRRSRLLILDHDYDEMIAYPLTSGGYSTPVISDMDQDSNLDILVPRFHFMNRFEMVAPFTSGIPLNWNQYRGRNWSGQRLEN